MVTNNILTNKDAFEFADYVRKSGGEVLKILALKQGFQFDIIRPSASNDTQWGFKAMNQFLMNREGKYVEATGNS